MRKVIITLLCMLPLTGAFAAKDPRDGRLDARIKTMDYHQGQVYTINAHYYRDSMVIFAEDEKIIHLGAGDPMAWQLVPVNNYLSMKPIEHKADTNLNVLTENLKTGAVRAYAFELSASRTKKLADDATTFMMTFRYPADELKERMAALAVKTAKQNAEVIINRKTAAADWNMEYSYAGNTSLVPVRTFDDGEFTYFQFPKNIDTPAIFLVDEQNNESLVNYHVTGKYVVVQRIGKKFILRDGGKATCIFNDTFNPRGEGTVMEINTVEVEKMKEDNEE